MGELEEEPEGPTFTQASNMDISGESGGRGKEASSATTGRSSFFFIMLSIKFVEEVIGSDAAFSVGEESRGDPERRGGRGGGECIDETEVEEGSEVVNLGIECGGGGNEFGSSSEGSILHFI